MSIGPWQGAVAANVVRAVPNDERWATLATLPSSGSLPDPDPWVHSRAVEPVARIGETGRLARWNPGDVALSRSPIPRMPSIRSPRRSSTGRPVYWVVHRLGVEVFTDSYETGYQARQHVDVDGQLTVPYTGTTLAAAELLDVEG